MWVGLTVNSKGSNQQNPKCTMEQILGLLHSPPVLIIHLPKLQSDIILLFLLILPSNHFPQLCINLLLIQTTCLINPPDNIRCHAFLNTHCPSVPNSVHPS